MSEPVPYSASGRRCIAYVQPSSLRVGEAARTCATLIIMLARTVVSSLVLLLLVTILLAKWATPSEVRAALPLTPPPIAPQAPFGPRSGQPSAPLTTTEVVTVTSTLSATPTLSATQVVSVTPVTSATVANAPTVTITASVTPSVTSSGAASLPRVVVITTTPASSILPTVTPTPPALLLLPTPTATRMPTTVPTVEPTLLPTSVAMLQPTRTPIATSAPTITPTESISPTIVAAPVVTSTVGLPSHLVTVSVPLPASYQAQGSFASQTVYTDSTIAQQQGTFTIVQAAALNEYGANQHYTLSTQRAVGELDEINVYQIDRYIAVSYTGGDWMVVRRDQGSNIVRAIQPITDLAVLFPRIINQAEFVGQEEINDVSSLRYRIDDPTGQGARLVQPLLALTGEIRSLRLDVWIAVPGGYVVAYNFQVELAGARVLDADGNEARADQAVTWTYQLTPNDEPEAIIWPADAPTPDAFPVPGFSVGEFPIPPNSELLALVGGVPDLISTLTPVQVDTFYRTELFTLGWTVEGEGGLLRCSKEGTNFQLLIAEDTATGGTRISILPAE